MSIEQIAPEALRLPARERALLAASLWESIGDPYAANGDQSDEEAIATAFRRDREIELGLVAPLSHEEMMRFLHS